MRNKVAMLLFLCLMGCANTKLQAIQGKENGDIIKEKGNPITKIHEGGKEMWTYRQENCTEMIFFDADGRVADLHELGVCPNPE